MANAENNHNMDRNSLYVAECFRRPGPILKRIRESSGAVRTVSKENVHITLVLKGKNKRRRRKVMGQKVNPHGARVGVIGDWDSRWFRQRESEIGDTLVQDYNLRKYLRRRPCTPPACRKSRSNATPPACASISTAPSPASSSARAARDRKSPPDLRKDGQAHPDQYR